MMLLSFAAVLSIFLLNGFLEIDAGAVTVTDENLRAFSEYIHARDENNGAQYVILDIQHRYDPRGPETISKNRLMNVNHNALRRKTTINELIALFENEDRERQINFLKAAVNTSVMKETLNFLRNMGAFQGNMKQFMDMLDRLWFTPYKRGSDMSSGFKHVFMAEKKRKGSQLMVNGMHNWIFYSLEEHKGVIKYLGWKKWRAFMKGQTGHVLAVKFTWRQMVKETGSMFVGTSPEMEMALYTTCFLIRPNAECPVEVGGIPIIIMTHTQPSDRGVVVGTAFPMIAI